MSKFAAVLTVGQLARLGNVSRFRMHRLLQSANVPMRKVGMKRLLFLSDVKRYLPALWESICEYQRLR